MKQTGLGVLLLMAALLTACSSEDKAQPEAVSREQPKTWKLCIQANKDDGNITRGVHFVSEVLKSKWNEDQPVEVYNESDELVGTLHAAASDDGHTFITGDISGSYTTNTSRLYLYSPSKARDYSGQTGTIESMSAKDYVSAEITVTAVDGSSGVLATSDAAFERLQSFNKFTVTPAMHTLHVVAEGMSPVTTTLSGTTDGTEFYVALPSTGGSAKSFTFMGRTNDNVVYTCSKTKQLVDGNYYSGSITLQDPGLLPGKFTINENGDQVRFSQGNLKYNGSTSTWSFFDNQWDYLETHDGTNWDHFGWSTSSTNYGMSTSKNDSDYLGDFVDWGNLAISNGGNTANSGWETLTAPSGGGEWTYLLVGRTTEYYTKRGPGTVGGKHGFILLPDDFTDPMKSTGFYGNSDFRYWLTNWIGNVYTAENWSAMEAAGAVFLPAAGNRNGTTVGDGGEYGYYWSTSPEGMNLAYYVMLFSSSVSVAPPNTRWNGYSVRLVRPVE